MGITIKMFRDIYIRGVPSMINDNSAFLSFVCCLTGLEALSGYRYPATGQVKTRLELFLTEYFPPEYASVVPAVYGFRNSMIHAFNPGPLLITHNQPRAHLKSDDRGTVVLNAESFFESFCAAAETMFAEVDARADRRDAFVQRLAHTNGGGILVRPVDVEA